MPPSPPSSWPHPSLMPLDAPVLPLAATDPKDKPKKPRHRHSAFQLAALNELYDKNEHPPLDERTALAERLGMEVKTVNAWFQNKRASSKKRHKPSPNTQFELPPISSLIASVSTPPAPPPDFDDLSDDDNLPPLSEHSLPQTSNHSEHSRRQPSFYAANPHQRHLFEPDQAAHRKVRSRPTPHQSEELRKLYERNPHPSKDEREELGDRIGMRYQSVTNWFQNQRSTAKKRREEEDSHSTLSKLDYDESPSSSRTYTPFPPSSSAVHPSLSLPGGHPSLQSLAIPPRMRRSPPLSIHVESRASSPRASPYRVAAVERASSVASGSRARRSRPEPYQLEALKKLFHRTPTPSIEERGALALEINMDVGKVTNWFRNLRQTTRRRTKRAFDEGDDDDDDDDSLATYTANSRDVSRAGSPNPSVSGSSPSLHEDGDVVMNDSVTIRYPHERSLRPRYQGKHHRIYSHVVHSRSHSDMGSDEEYQEAVTPSPSSSPPPPSFAPPAHLSKRMHATQSPGAITFAVDTLSYAEMEKATAKYTTGVKVEDALLLLSFHHNVVR